MFTSNDELYSKLFGKIPESGIVELVGSHSGANRGYDEDFLRRACARLGPDNDSRFDRRLPSQSGGNVKLKEPEKDQDLDQRKVHFRNAARNMYGKDARDLYSGIRNGSALDEDSSGSSGSRYGGPSRYTKLPQSYLRTQSEFKTPSNLKTPPDLKASPDVKTPPNSKAIPQFLPPQGNDRPSPEFNKRDNHGDRQSYGNQLLNLRAALSEKELQLVELREQHLNLLNRAAESRQNWEEALASKDRVILQLHRKTQQQESQLDRQEKENQENLYALRKRQDEIMMKPPLQSWLYYEMFDKSEEVEKIELKVAFLEAKNAQFVQELMEQQKLITRMKRHIDEQEKLCAHQCRKMERLNGKVQNLKASLHEKAEMAETQDKYVTELKTFLWKRDSIIAQLQLTEQQLQSALAREKADREALSMSREKVQEEKDLIEKRLSEMQNQQKAVANGASQVHHERRHHQSETRKLAELKDDFSNIQEGVLKDVDDKEGVMHRMQKRIRELQRSLKSKDIALSEKNSEHQQALQDIQRIAEDYEALKQEYEEVNKRNDDLENTVSHLQEYSDGRMDASVSEVWTPPVEVLPYECSMGGSTGEGSPSNFKDLVDNTMLDSTEFESEQLSNASVYHANFEKIKCGTPVQIIEVEMPDIDQQQQKHGATAGNSSFPPPVPPVTPLPPSVPASPQQPPLGAPPRSSPPPSAGPSDKNCEGHSSDFEAKHSSIQDEIMRREQSWRKTEELMRAALTRRMKLLELARDVKSAKTETAIAETELHNRNGHLHIQHHLEVEASVRENQAIADHKTRLKEAQRIHLCRKPIDGEGHRLKHHIPHRKVNGQKHHAQDGHASRRHRHAHEHDFFQEECRISHNMRKGERRHQHGEPEMMADRRRHSVQNSQLEDCTARSEHYGHYEGSGHNARSGYTRKGNAS